MIFWKSVGDIWGVIYPSLQTIYIKTIDPVASEDRGRFPFRFRTSSDGSLLPYANHPPGLHLAKSITGLIKTVL